MTQETWHIEVAKTRKTIDPTLLQERVIKFIFSLPPTDIKGQIIECNSNNCPELHEHVQNIVIDSNFEGGDPDKACLIFHTFIPQERPSEIELFENDGDGSTEEIPASNHWILPSKEFMGLWESLIYEDGLKENIMNFIETSILFGNRNVNHHIISCNRIVLLHGPPGTGKTSLCKAIAQKLSIRLNSVYNHTHLIEINSHSLFSKWFSESGKLVMKLFSKIKELISMPKSLVCVLIDEIESLAYARDSISGNEPRDAIRVVNAVLTQLDQIKNYQNVLILTTSNLTSSIDLAFIDRSDIKQFIGYPSVRAIYDIYSSAIKELIRVNIIETTQKIIPFNRLEFTLSSSSPSSLNGLDNKSKNSFQINEKLLNASQQSIGLSGRTLRKLPFLAHALYCKDNKLSSLSSKISLEQFIDALILAIERERSDQNKIKQEHEMK